MKTLINHAIALVTTFCLSIILALEIKLAMVPVGIPNDMNSFVFMSPFACRSKGIELHCLDRCVTRCFIARRHLPCFLMSGMMRRVGRGRCSVPSGEGRRESEAKPNWGNSMMGLYVSQIFIHFFTVISIFLYFCMDYFFCKRKIWILVMSLESAIQRIANQFATKNQPESVKINNNR